MEPTETKLSTPMAIIVAGVIIAGAVYFSSLEKPAQQVADGVSLEQAQLLENVRPVDETDHIRGSLDADIIIVEYSDTECPFCQRFHNTMKSIVEKYEGKVAWVYRHSPIDSLHPKARKEAEALECANEQGGNDAFWTYTDRLYAITPTNNGLDLAKLPEIAQYVGLDVNVFIACLESGRWAERVEADTQNAYEIGGGGTPWSVLITKDGKKYPIQGAQPIELISTIIDQALK